MQPLFLVWILLIGFMFYFLMIKPQKKARAQQVDMLSHLAVGSEVRTTAQILGTVVELGEDYAVVETTPGVRIKFGKAAIVGIVLPDTAETETEAEAEDAPVAGGIGDAPETADAEPLQDAVPADASPVAEDAPADAEPASKS